MSKKKEEKSRLWLGIVAALLLLLLLLLLGAFLIWYFQADITALVRPQVEVEVEVDKDHIVFGDGTTPNDSEKDPSEEQGPSENPENPSVPEDEDPSEPQESEETYTVDYELIYTAQHGAPPQLVKEHYIELFTDKAAYSPGETVRVYGHKVPGISFSVVGDRFSIEGAELIWRDEDQFYCEFTMPEENVVITFEIMY